MATRCSILAREILWTEKTGTLQSMGLQKTQRLPTTNVGLNGTKLLSSYKMVWYIRENESFKSGTPQLLSQLHYLLATKI